MRAALAIAAALFAAAPGTAQGWRPSSEVELRLDGYRLSPRIIAMRPGEATRLRLVNTGRAAATLRARDFFAAARLRPRDRARVANGAIAVPAGRTIELVVVPAAGRYPIASRAFVPRLLGMRGQIVVEARRGGGS